MKDSEVTGGKPKNYTINYGENLFAFASKGWQCPICQRVMSPYISYCIFCPQQIKTITQDNVDTIKFEGTL